jgi:hypothetical protein
MKLTLRNCSHSFTNRKIPDLICKINKFVLNLIFMFIYLFIPYFPLPKCHHMSLMDFVVSPPGCGRSVTDF